MLRPCNGALINMQKWLQILNNSENTKVDTPTTIDCSIDMILGTVFGAVCLYRVSRTERNNRT